jgi:hypothetical protein
MWIEIGISLINLDNIVHIDKKVIVDEKSDVKYTYRIEFHHTNNYIFILYFSEPECDEILRKIKKKTKTKVIE